MLAKKRTIGVDPLPNIRDVNFVAPRGIDLTHSNYVIMDGSYYTYLYIRKGGYPTTVRGGWDERAHQCRRGYRRRFVPAA